MRDELMRGRTRLIFLFLGITAIPMLFALAERQPALFANTTVLGALLALQIAFVALNHFEKGFFPLLIGTFLWAGSALPLYGTAMSVRWLFLGIGSLGGFVIWIKGPRVRHLGWFHLAASFCVVSAVVSAAVSEAPKTALLKVLSLFLLFLYVSTGVRIAIAGREKEFVRNLVLACEILVYSSAVCYFVLGFSVFGNPNSLGAIICIVAVPILLWAASVAETRGLRQRRFLSLILCGGLLLTSNSRASILAATVVLVVFVVAIRQQRLLLQCAFLCLFLMTVMAVVNPWRMKELVSSFTGRVIYKEQGASHGVFRSRLSPWTETVSVIRQHPWLGSGFGTSDLGTLRPDSAPSSVYTSEGTNREHGSSYLALAEYLGILGAAPFLILLLVLLRTVARAYCWMRRSGNAYHYCIPFALVVTAGLVHACFEDWLFAVGSYLCLFFWISASVLIDLVPAVESGKPSIVLQPRANSRVQLAPAVHSLH